MREYQDRIDDEVLAIGAVEDIDAVKTIHEVVATEGLKRRHMSRLVSRRLAGNAGECLERLRNFAQQAQHARRA